MNKLITKIKLAGNDSISESFHERTWKYFFVLMENVEAWQVIKRNYHLKFNYMELNGNFLRISVSHWHKTLINLRGSFLKFVIMNLKINDLINFPLGDFSPEWLMRSIKSQKKIVTIILPARKRLEIMKKDFFLFYCLGQQQQNIHGQVSIQLFFLRHSIQKTDH